MNKALTTILLAACVVTSSAHAAFVNDFHCTLNEGHDLQKLFEFQQEWMQAARENGFDEGYETRVLLPVYNVDTRTEPLRILWRGEFKDGDQLGRMMDWFLTDPWAARFRKVMECEEASLWFAPQ